MEYLIQHHPPDLTWLRFICASCSAFDSYLHRSPGVAHVLSPWYEYGREVLVLKHLCELHHLVAEVVLSSIAHLPQYLPNEQAKMTLKKMLMYIRMCCCWGRWWEWPSGRVFKTLDPTQYQESVTPIWMLNVIIKTPITGNLRAKKSNRHSCYGITSPSRKKEACHIFLQHPYVAVV